MLSDEISKIEINDAKLNTMKKLIISAERDNIKTGNLAPQEMIKTIKKIIEKNVD